MSFTQCLVIGANRGIGYEFVQQLLQKPNHKVFATYRDSNSIKNLEELASEKTIQGRLELVHLDMGDDASCKTAAKGIKDKAGGLDLLIVNAGINSGTKKPLLEEEINELNRLFNGNVLGPLRICQAFAPMLKDRPGQSKLLLMSSEAGSLTTSKHGRSPPYAISKAGLNMMGRKLAYELESSKVAVGMLHPGWVQTEMGGPNAEISAKESVSGMLKVIDQLDMSNSGEFWVYDGKHHDW